MLVDKKPYYLSSTGPRSNGTYIRQVEVKDVLHMAKFIHDKRLFSNELGG